MIRRAWSSSTITTWGSILVRLAGVLVTLPLVLRQFPPAEVAVWQLFLTLFGLVLLFDFGVTPTAARLLSYARGGATLADMGAMRDINRVKQQAPLNTDTIASVTRRLYGSLQWLYPRMAIGVVALFAVFGTWGLLKPVAQCAEPARVWLAWSLVLAGSYFAFLGNAYSAALQGLDHIASLRRWEIAVGVAQVATAASILAAGGDILWLVVMHQSWTVFNTWRNRRLLSSLEPHLADQPACRDVEVNRQMWPQVWRSGVGVLFGQGIVQASGMGYGQSASGAELASYLLALRVASTLSQFSAAPFYSKLPRLATLHAKGEHSDQLQLAQRGMGQSQWVLAAGALAVGFAVPPLLQIIGSQTDFVSPGVWALMAAAFFVERFGAMHLQLYSLTNHIVWHIANGITGLLMLGMALLLFPTLHVAALPTAMLIAYAGFYSVYAVRHSSRAFRFSLARFELRAGAPAAAMLIAGLALSVWAPHWTTLTP